MAVPFTVPLATDPTVIQGELIAAVQTVNPNFRAVGLTKDLTMAAATVIAESRANFVDRLRSEVMTLVGDLFGVPRSIGSPATSSITVTALDALGHADIVDGDLLYVGDIQCRTTGPLVIDVGSTSGSVGIEATEPGTQFEGAIADVEIPQFAWVNTVELDEPLSGGADPDDDDAYAVRLRDDAQTRTVAVVQPRDGVIRARRVPAVGWAYTVEDWDPTLEAGAGAYAERHRTLVVTDREGGPVGGGVLAAIQADIDALTPGNWIWHVTNATYVPVDVSAIVSAKNGWESFAAGNAEAALTERVSAVRWITPDYSLDPGFLPGRRVHDSILIAAAKNAQGVDIVEQLEIGDGASDELVLDSPTKLPTPGEITVELLA